MKQPQPCPVGQSCQLCHANQFARLLNGAGSAVVEAFEKNRTGRLYPAGFLLYRQGSCGDALYCISSGRIKIYRTDPAGRVQILRLAGPGDFFGWRRLISNRPSSNSAQVVASAFVCKIPGKTVLAALAGDPRIARNILSAQARALERTESQLMKQLGLSSPARVASLLLELSPPPSPAAVASLTREEMAQLTGTSVESVSRFIQEMARRGSLRLRGRSIFVVDRQALEQFIEREYQT
ncbi:MAG: Crp/Fnr family transcriptional regulator [Candidatus Eremiobacteraeota bacterium]|nr:Crp/Fnr family transcriptional regulator [Candidatus Eremiobacteraeota bacterium]MCW5869594.1 Crp/Fnr family transcriptional regulator [Candidatus Eremiobacteraeota bacterium]